MGFTRVDRQIKQLLSLVSARDGSSDQFPVQMPKRPRQVVRDEQLRPDRMANARHQKPPLEAHAVNSVSGGRRCCANEIQQRSVEISQPDEVRAVYAPGHATRCPRDEQGHAVATLMQPALVASQTATAIGATMQRRVVKVGRRRSRVWPPRAELLGSAIEAAVVTGKHNDRVGERPVLAQSCQQCPHRCVELGHHRFVWTQRRVSQNTSRSVRRVHCRCGGHYEKGPHGYRSATTMPPKGQDGLRE